MTRIEKVICEAEHNGEIDLETRNAMLKVYSESTHNDTPVEESTENSYDKVKNFLFEKELQGMITVDERNTLLEKVEERIIAKKEVATFESLMRELDLTDNK